MVYKRSSETRHKSHFIERAREGVRRVRQLSATPVKLKFGFFSLSTCHNIFNVEYTRITHPSTQCSLLSLAHLTSAYMNFTVSIIVCTAGPQSLFTVICLSESALDYERLNCIVGSSPQRAKKSLLF